MTETMKEQQVRLSDYPGGRIHMIGISGSSMSGLSIMLRDMGYHVSGSCNTDSEKVRKLIRSGIPVIVGHRPENVHGADLVVYTTAVSTDHTELVEARRLGIPVLSRPQLLGQISNLYVHTIAISGTHGKTTTTSMIAKILLDAKKDPAIHIGGVLPEIGGSVRTGNSDLFVTEACEYKQAFLQLSPYIAIVLNIDLDHLDCYKDLDDIENAFGRFLDHVNKDGWIIGNGTDQRVVHLLSARQQKQAVFGWDKTAAYYPAGYTEDEEGHGTFSFMCRGEELCHLTLAVPGRFNTENAMAALTAAHILGVDMNVAAKSLENFHGAACRFEKKGVINGVELFCDYGHNPTEIRNALSIARKRCKGTLISVLEPHTFNRLRSLFDDHALCTKEADITLVTDVFAARETVPDDLNSGMLVEAMKANGINAVWTPTYSDAIEMLHRIWKPGDLVITQGCGMIYSLIDMLLQEEKTVSEDL